MVAGFSLHPPIAATPLRTRIHPQGGLANPAAGCDEPRLRFDKR